jgi:hypothetical protein
VPYALPQPEPARRLVVEARESCRRPSAAACTRGA